MALDQEVAESKTATIYRMVMKEHTCPYGLKAKALLERNGLAVTTG